MFGDRKGTKFVINKSKVLDSKFQNRNIIKTYQCFDDTLVLPATSPSSQHVECGGDGIRAGQGATLVESRQTAYDAKVIVRAAPVNYNTCKKIVQGTLDYRKLNDKNKIIYKQTNVNFF